MSIILFIVVLVVLVLVHEFGHFIVAKKSGIRVDEFGIGFPPKLFSIKKGETEYSLNALPFGGFVRIFGENPSDVKADPESTTYKRSFIGKSRGVQAAVVVAGVVGNIMLAWVLLSVGYMVGLPTSADNVPKGATFSDPAVTVVELVPGSPADRAGLMIGDRIQTLTFEGGETDAISTTESVGDLINKHGKEAITVGYVRGSDSGEVVLTPEEHVISNGLAIGVGLEVVGNASLPAHRAFVEGGTLTYDLTKEVVISLTSFFKQFFVGTANLNEVAGPVGIVSLVGQALNHGFIALLIFVAVISINLAVINLIPFPALDGGRLLFILVESITRRPIPSRFANAANALGFILLIVFLVVVTFHDITRFFV